VKSSYRYRSFIWPAIFILAGVFALLANEGVLSVDSLYQLVDLWPLILIVSGLEIIVHRSLQGRAAELAAPLIVLVAIAGAIAYVAVAPNVQTTRTMDASESVGGLDQVSLEIDAGSASVTINAGGSSDSDLYKAHIQYSGPKPRVSLDRGSGDLRITQSSPNFAFFQNHKFVLNLTLNPDVTWAITDNSGASTDTLNLAGVKVGSIQLNTGASHSDIILGPPSGIVPVTINGGAVTVHVHRPGGTPVSVAVSGGAVSLDADGKQTHSIGDANYQSPGFSGAADAYQIEVNCGACTVTLN
jgi:Domain of unknown function (DUF5668)